MIWLILGLMLVVLALMFVVRALEKELRLVEAAFERHLRAHEEGEEDDLPPLVTWETYVDPVFGRIHPEGGQDGG